MHVHFLSSHSLRQMGPTCACMSSSLSCCLSARRTGSRRRRFFWVCGHLTTSSLAASSSPCEWSSSRQANSRPPLLSPTSMPDRFSAPWIHQWQNNGDCFFVGLWRSSINIERCHRLPFSTRRHMLTARIGSPSSVTLTPALPWWSTTPRYAPVPLLLLRWACRFILPAADAINGRFRWLLCSPRRAL